MPSAAFTVVELPRSYDEQATAKLAPIFAEKSKTLRLHSLQTNPEAFSSTYAREIAFPPEQWLDRLKNPVARTFMAVDLRETGADESSTLPQTSASDEPAELLETAAIRPWIGSTVLIGPKIFAGALPTASTSPWTLFHLSHAKQPLSAPEETEAPHTKVYMINAVYVLPSGRGLGVGKALVGAAVAVAEQDAQKADAEGESEVAVLVFVEKDNVAATELYRACGFVDMGEEAYTATDGRKGVAVALRRDIKVVRD
jgi:ribosomal protein S18 acetylase RimI-like enzyme